MQNAVNNEKKGFLKNFSNGIKVPHTLVIIFSIIILTKMIINVINSEKTIDFLNISPSIFNNSSITLIITLLIGSWTNIIINELIPTDCTYLFLALF